MFYMRILFLAFYILLVTSCKEKPTVDLVETRDRITYFMHESDPSLQKLSPEEQQAALQLFLNELDRYQHTDAILSPLELYDLLSLLLDSLEQVARPMSLRADFVNNIAGPFLYDIGKHNHLKTHKDLSDFPTNADSYITWLSIHNQRATLFDNLRFTADSILWVLDENQLLNQQELDNIGKQIFKDLSYFEETSNLTPRQTEKVKNESLQVFVVQIMNDYYFRIKEIYDEAEALALTPVQIPQIEYSNTMDWSEEESPLNSLDTALNLLVDELQRLDEQGKISENQMEQFSECFDRISSAILDRGNEEQLQEVISTEFANLKRLNLPPSLYEHTVIFYYAFSQQTGVNIEAQLMQLLE